MKKIIFTLSFLAFLGLSTLHAQVKVGNNPTSIDASAAFEVESTNKGLLPPRMETADRDGIASPVEGLTIYNTDNNCLEFFNGTAWISACDGQVVTTPAPPPQDGSTFTSYDNGSGEFFSQNTTCQNKLISAQHNSTTCNGNVVVGSNTYPVVLINGQCWMQTNLNEAPTAPCAGDINTGCNIWTNNSPGDIGSWGYYNTSTTDGSAGWATSEPASDEGLLYQWSAAMNNSTTERAQGVCPTGWHIPSDCEWMYLEHGLGMSITDQQTTSLRSSGSVGSQLSTLTSSGSNSNSSGFTALLAGNRNANGGFNNRGSIGLWWSSSEASPATAHSRYLESSEAGVYRFSDDKARAFSVRCIKD